MPDCPCKHEGQRRFDRWDAWWCPGCGWRSPGCSDPECEFCAKRPDDPTKD